MRIGQSIDLRSLKHFHSIVTEVCYCPALRERSDMAGIVVQNVQKTAGETTARECLSPSGR
jgi:hypothetical protein